MPRLPRLNLTNIPQHVIQRGNNRQACFCYEQDYQVYLTKLLEYSDKYKVNIHAFVLMTNHVHLLATPRLSNGVSLMMQSLGRYYVRYFNQRYKRSGTLWEGRFKSCLVDSDNYFLTVTRYIEFNPVRAAMVKNPAQYSWSSYHHNALGKQIKLLTEHQCYINLGISPEVRQEAYRRLCEQYLNEKTINEIREAVNKSYLLGCDGFKQQMEEKVGRKLSPKPKGGDRKSEKFLSKKMINKTCQDK